METLRLCLDIFLELRFFRRMVNYITTENDWRPFIVLSESRTLFPNTSAQFPTKYLKSIANVKYGYCFTPNSFRYVILLLCAIWITFYLLKELFNNPYLRPAGQWCSSSAGSSKASIKHSLHPELSGRQYFPSGFASQNLYSSAKDDGKYTMANWNIRSMNTPIMLQLW